MPETGLFFTYKRPPGGKMFAAKQTSCAPAKEQPRPAPLAQPGPQIISASRRTDIPACYPQWFISRVQAGWVRCYHPFTGAEQTIPLSPEQVVAFVFWTHNCAPFLPHLEVLDRLGYTYYFLHTLTALPKALEPGLPEAALVLSAMRRLARRLGAHRLHWRYDPIVITKDLHESYHLRTFRRLARVLQGSTDRAIVSFVYPYARVMRRLGRAQVGWQDPPPDRKSELIGRLADIAEEYGMRLAACCPNYPIPAKVQKAHCIDAGVLRLLRPDLDCPFPLAATRAGCGCARSVDIGAYDTCGHGCLYCYATSRPLLAKRRWQAHSATSASLLPRPRGG